MTRTKPDAISFIVFRENEARKRHYGRRIVDQVKRSIHLTHKYRVELDPHRSY